MTGCGWRGSWKRSLHLQQFRKRFIVLRGNELICYKTQTKRKITERILLHEFGNISHDETAAELGRFYLVPKTATDKRRVFRAASQPNSEEWVTQIGHCLSLGAMEQKEDEDGGDAPGVWCS